ncbi:hypothetical protein F2Q69_00031304 [Brassica cretica]|uniref:Uncharacterized protein n=1 Tax=Brassica cretica TaxID=69181 RepID=A0A8S9S4K8_BRACR|nr:hypothetical protein F2Q69_00031304 [Brassica cretica]
MDQSPGVHDCLLRTSATGALRGALSLGDYGGCISKVCLIPHNLVCELLYFTLILFLVFINLTLLPNILQKKPFGKR